MKKIKMLNLTIFILLSFFSCTHIIKLPFLEVNIVHAEDDQPIVLGVLTDDNISKFILTALANQYGISYEIHYFDDIQLLLDSVENGTVDFASNIPYQSDYILNFDFTIPVDTNDTYLYSYDKFIVNDMNNKTIAIPTGSDFNNILKAKYNNINIVYYNTYDTFLSMLETHTVDGAIANMVPYEDAYREHLTITKLNNTIAIKPVAVFTKIGTNQSTLEAFSSYISSSDFQTSLLEYKTEYSNAIYQSILSEKIKEYFPDTNLTLTVKLENNSPFSYYEKDGTHLGLFTDTLTQICGILDVTCNIVSTPSEKWDSMYQDLKSGAIDVLAPVTKTDEREKILHFSDSVLTSDYVILNRTGYNPNNFNNISQLLYEKIGSLPGDVKDEYLKSIFPNKQFTYFDNNTDMIKGLSRGEVDYILINENTFITYLQNTYDFSIEENKELGTIFSNDICFAFPNTTRGEHLAELFSLSLKLVNINDIKDQYIHEVSYTEFAKQNENLHVLLIIILIVITLSLGIILAIVLTYSKKSKYKANHDSLTGLYNRRYFNENIHLIDQMKNYPLAYIVADINGLNFINNSFGHKMGDQVIVEYSNIIKNIFIDSVLIRMGGDEFLILSSHANEIDIERNIKKMLNAAQRNKDFPVKLSVAVGYFIKYNSDLSTDESYDQAEDKMYHDKMYNIGSRRSDSIETILSTLHEKDPYSEEHSRNVSEFSARFAEILEMKRDKVNEIRSAGILHDVGKIMIPTAILCKKGTLTKEEYETIKKHAEIGFRITNSLHDMEHISHIILSHHERWDGTGYPNGKSKNDIPLESRIIAIADAFDAMTSERLYKNKISNEDAIQELIRCSGTQFDPYLIEVLIKNINRVIKKTTV